MGLFRRRRAGAASPAARRKEESSAVAAHLAEFVRSRPGVEAYVEPQTTVTPPTVVLIADTGEWTRRRVPDPAVVRGLARDLNVPVYDVQLTGYPQRMRDWNARQKASGADPKD
jgi:hypothetical protein